MIKDKMPVHEEIELQLIDGVEMSEWSVVEKIGHIVIVNMGVYINTSKVSVSTNTIDRTVIVKNFPIAKKGQAFFDAWYINPNTTKRSYVGSSICTS